MKIGILHTAFIGDLALAGLMIEALWQEGHSITLLARKGGCLLYKGDPRLAKTVAVDKGKGWRKFQALKALANTIADEHFDWLLVPHRAPSTAWAVMASGVKAAGFEGDFFAPFAFEHRGQWLDKVHEAQRLLALVPPEVLPLEKRRQWMSFGRPVLPGPKDPLTLQTFQSTFPTFDWKVKPFFLIAPGSVWPTKCYPPHLLAQVVSRVLLENPSLTCVVSGGPGDESAVAETLKGVTGDVLPRVLDASKVLPLADLVALTAHARFVVVNDSAPLHIASGTNTPTVAVFGPTSHLRGLGPTAERSEVVTRSTALGQTLPCQPCSPHGHVRCPLGHWSCMNELPPEAVCAAIKRLFPKGIS